MYPPQAKERAEMLVTKDIARTFKTFNLDGHEIPVAEGQDLSVNAGECVVLQGPSTDEESTLLRMLFGNYTIQKGAIRVRHQGAWVDISLAGPQEILSVRKFTMGYVSHVLRVLPQVCALDIVAEPLLALGEDIEVVHDRAKSLLTRLQVPEKLWSLSPATFSRSEQQRINIARVFIADYPVLLLDDPTSFLDVQSAQIVASMILESMSRGTAIVGVTPKAELRKSICTRVFEIAHQGCDQG